MGQSVECTYCKVFLHINGDTLELLLRILIQKSAVQQKIIFIVQNSYNLAQAFPRFRKTGILNISKG